MATVWRRIGWCVILGGALVACSSQRTATSQTPLAPQPSTLEKIYQDGRLAFKERHYTDAAAHFARVVALDPESLKARLNWAAALSYSNRPTEAIVQCQHVLERDPTNAEAYYQWGAILVRQGKHLEAMEKFDQALALKPMAELLPDAPALQQSFQAYLNRQRRQRSDAEVVRPKPAGDGEDTGRMPTGR